MDVSVSSIVRKFTDDTKIDGVVDREEGYLTLERDHDHLGQLAKEW